MHEALKPHEVESVAVDSIFDLPVHPVAALFPMCDDAQLREMARDIAENGQQHAVVIWRDQLVDGRNRLAACKLAEVEPEWISIDNEPDPIPFIISSNLHRRHLSVSQRSLIAAGIKKCLEPAAQERMKSGKGVDGSGGRGNKKNHVANLHDENPVANLRSRDVAASMMDVSPRMVDHADQVLESGVPELQAATRAGTIAVSRAAKIAKMPSEAQIAEIERVLEVPRQEKSDRERVVEFIQRHTNRMMLVLRVAFELADPITRRQLPTMWQEWCED